MIIYAQPQYTQPQMTLAACCGDTLAMGAKTLLLPINQPHHNLHCHETGLRRNAKQELPHQYALTAEKLRLAVTIQR